MLPRRLLVALAGTALAVLALRESRSLHRQIDRLETRVQMLTEESDRNRMNCKAAAVVPFAALARTAMTAAAAARSDEARAPIDGAVAPREPPPQPPPELSETEPVEPLDARFSSQDYDRPWAESAEASLGDAFKDISALGAELRPPECRRSMCRVGVFVREQQQQSAVVRKLLAPPPAWEGESMALTEDRGPDGSITLTLFLARKGQSL